MTATVRFAPSPTGMLHVGNARTALINWLFARQSGGEFILRFDDTDSSRSRESYVAAIEADLTWLGLDWVRVVRQSARLDLYREAFARLRAAGRIYCCYETPEELELKRRLQLARRKPPIYDRSALRLTDDDRRALEAKGRRPHWRFLLEPGDVAWEDLVRGPVRLSTSHISDPVVVRADGTFLYMLPSTVDDSDLAVTHVIRGEDHVSNTAIQIQMFRALAAEPPVFAHVPLLTDSAGKGLSKRLGSLTVRSLAGDGVEPLPLAAFLARLGTGEPADLAPSLDGLARDFDISRLGRATPRFDETQLRHLNERFLHQTPFALVRTQLADLSLDHADDAFWQAVRPNLHRIGEAKYWHDVCFGNIAPIIEDADFVARAAALLPAEPWDERTWDAWVKSVQAATGRRGKDLFLPLRLALTGKAHGPELRQLLPLIGRTTAVRRLQGAGACVA
jgi:glutamyl-tRNA synthetase